MSLDSAERILEAHFFAGDGKNAYDEIVGLFNSWAPDERGERLVELCGAFAGLSVVAISNLAGRRRRSNPVATLHGCANALRRLAAD